MQRVAEGEPRVALRTLAVELDTLETDVLLQQRLRQQRHGLSHKAVKTLTGVILFYCKLLHGLAAAFYIIYSEKSLFSDYTI